jgi:hypothetical protein
VLGWSIVHPNVGAELGERNGKFTDSRRLLRSRYRHFKCRQHHVNAAAEFVDPVEASVRLGIRPGYVITIVRELLAGCDVRSLAHDLISLDYQARSIGVNNDPFTAEQRDCAIRSVFDRDEVYERVRLVGRQASPTMMVAEPIEARGEAGEFA